MLRQTNEVVLVERQVLRGRDAGYPQLREGLPHNNGEEQMQGLSGPSRISIVFFSMTIVRELQL